MIPKLPIPQQISGSWAARNAIASNTAKRLGIQSEKEREHIVLCVDGLIKTAEFIQGNDEFIKACFAHRAAIQEMLEQMGRVG